MLTNPLAGFTPFAWASYLRSRRDKKGPKKLRLSVGGAELFSGVGMFCNLGGGFLGCWCDGHESKQQRRSLALTSYDSALGLTNQKRIRERGG